MNKIKKQSKDTLNKSLDLHQAGMKSRCTGQMYLLLKPLHVQGSLWDAIQHLDDPEEDLGEYHVVRSNQNQTFKYKLNSSSLEEEDLEVF